MSVCFVGFDNWVVVILSYVFRLGSFRNFGLEVEVLFVYSEFVESKWKLNMGNDA